MGVPIKGAYRNSPSLSDRCRKGWPKKKNDEKEDGVDRVGGAITSVGKCLIEVRRK